MSIPRRQRITRLLAVLIRWGAGVLLIALLASWALSRTHRHGVVVDGLRRYAISSVDGSIELRYATLTDPDFTTTPTKIKDRPFAPPGRRFDVRWFGPAGPGSVPVPPSGSIWSASQSWPMVMVERSLWPQSAEMFSGGEFPVFEPPSAGGTITISYAKFGQRIRVTFVPYWIPVAAVAVVFVLTLAVRRRAPAGHCRRCGYDLRASPDRCPECGTAVA